MKKQNIFVIRGLFVGAVFHLTCMVAVAEVAVVVGAKSTVTKLTAEQVTGIFMGKSKSFPDGSPAVAIDQTESSPIRVEFTSKVLGKDEAQLKSYWSRLVFTGKGAPPKEHAGSAAVKSSLANDPKLVGYIEKSAVDASVKVVFAAP